MAEHLTAYWPKSPGRRVPIGWGFPRLGLSDHPSPDRRPCWSPKIDTRWIELRWTTPK